MMVTSALTQLKPQAEALWKLLDQGPSFSKPDRDLFQAILWLILELKEGLIECQFMLNVELRSISSKFPTSLLCLCGGFLCVSERSRNSLVCHDWEKKIKHIQVRGLYPSGLRFLPLSCPYEDDYATKWGPLCSPLFFQDKDKIRKLLDRWPSTASSVDCYPYHPLLFGYDQEESSIYVWHQEQGEFHLELASVVDLSRFDLDTDFGCDQTNRNLKSSIIVPLWKANCMFYWLEQVPS